MAGSMLQSLRAPTYCHFLCPTTRKQERCMLKKRESSRREFFSATALGTAGIAAALADPPQAAAQSVGVKRGDLPDLTIKEVKVYVTDLTGLHKLNSTETGEIISVVTESGIEGNYTIGNRNLTPNWLEWAKPALTGKNVIDLLPTITATSGLKATYGFGAGTRGGANLGGGRGAGGGGRGGAGRGGAAGAGGRGGAGGGFNGGYSPRGAGTWPNYYTAAEIALWD